MKPVSSPTVCLGGALTAAAVLFHSAPVFLPGAGLILSPFATLPIALAAVASVYLGVTTLFAAALILLMISPQEAVILLLTTGPLGIALGACFKRPLVKSIIFASSPLFGGIILLTYAIGVPAFGNITSQLAMPAIIFLYFIFSTGYSILWIYFLKLIVRLLKKAKLPFMII